MRTNPVKETLAAGGTCLGTMVFEFSTPGIGRIMANAGADFAVFDMEHTGWSIETIRMLMATTRGADLVPVVRVPATEYHLLTRPLDAGAMGLMVPMVESEDQARRIVQAGKYPPVGRRGAAFGLAHDDYAQADIVATMEHANAHTLLIAQIETSAGVEAAGEIAAVDGIDVLWIGQFDLTVSLGIPGEFDHPAYLEAVERILEAAREHGKAAGMMVSAPQEAAVLLDQGFRAIAWSGDLWIYGQALRTGLDTIRGMVPETP
jgi:2-dehydro-3-deoxyglucarate aldolase/4-hydroxy-2-oxoheptanedioate aldolase